jgi:hypothetical protein
MADPVAEEKKSTDEPIVIGAHADEKIACAQCGKEGTSATHFSYQGKDGKDIQLCPECRAKVNAEIEGEEKKVNMGGAIGLGAIASVVGGVIWYYITLGTGSEFGYVAIGLGYMVGYAVYLGAGKNRAHKIQIAAGLITIVTIFITEWYIYNHFLTEYFFAHPDEFPAELERGSPVQIDMFSPVFLQSFLSPISLLIYAIGAYVGYQVPKPQKI